MKRRELASSGPRSYPVPRGSRPWPELITAGTSKAVLREVGRSVQAGELAASGPLERLEDGRWAVPVWRIRERQVKRRWRKPLLVAGGVTVVLGGLAALGWWLAGMATAALASLSLPAVAMVAALGWLTVQVFSSGGSHGGCETTVTVRHRHW